MTQTSVVVFETNSAGATALIWFALTYSNGAETPSNVTFVSPREVGNRPSDPGVPPTGSEGPRFWPKRLTSSNGAIRNPFKEAALPMQVRFTSPLDVGPIFTSSRFSAYTPESPIIVCKTPIVAEPPVPVIHSGDASGAVGKKVDWMIAPEESIRTR